jgi:hypothetical protein
MDLPASKLLNKLHINNRYIDNFMYFACSCVVCCCVHIGIVMGGEADIAAIVSREVWGRGVQVHNVTYVPLPPTLPKRYIK